MSVRAPSYIKATMLSEFSAHADSTCIKRNLGDEARQYGSNVHNVN